MSSTMIRIPGIGLVDRKIVRKTIRSLMPLADFAAAMGVHPSALSKWLSGVNNIPTTFAAMLIISAQKQMQANALVFAANWPASGTAQDQLKALKDAWGQGLNPFTGHQITSVVQNPATNNQTTTKVKAANWKEEAFNKFPAKKWYDFLEGSRKAFKEGQSSTALGPRTNITLTQCYLALVNDGMDEDDAFRQAFKHCILDRVLSGEQEFLMNLYFTNFGKRHPLIDIEHPLAKVEEVPFAPYIRSYVKFGIPTWVYGSPGSGKTYSTQMIAEEFNRELVRVPCSKFLTPEETFAGLEIKEGKSYAKDGMVTAAIRRVVDGQSEGCIILIDEFSRLQPGLSTTFHSLMEMRELVVPLTGERIPVDRTKVAVVINDNLKGLAEDAAFTGAEAVDEATRDRCVFVEAGYPGEKTETHIVQESIKWVPENKFNIKPR